MLQIDTWKRVLIWALVVAGLVLANGTLRGHAFPVPTPSVTLGV